MSSSTHPPTPIKTLTAYQRIHTIVLSTVSPKQGLNTINYWLFVGTPILVFLLIVLLVVVRIYSRKSTCCRCCSIEKGQNRIENTTICFNNSTYSKFISLDTNSISHQRTRSLSCPDITQLDPTEINVMYANIEPPAEDEFNDDYYVDPAQYNEQFEEASRLYRSENDINRVQIVSGSSHGKFQRLLTQSNKEKELFPSYKFASYVKYNGTNNVYKIPSNVSKFEPPPNTPPTIPVAPIKYKNMNDISSSIDAMNASYTDLLAEPMNDAYDQPYLIVERYGTQENIHVDGYGGGVAPFYHELEKEEESYNTLLKADEIALNIRSEDF